MESRIKEKAENLVYKLKNDLDFKDSLYDPIKGEFEENFHAYQKVRKMYKKAVRKNKDLIVLEAAIVILEMEEDRLISEMMEEDILKINYKSVKRKIDENGKI